jgi:RND family efflux transporter MFP subunit
MGVRLDSFDAPASLDARVDSAEFGEAAGCRQAAKFGGEGVSRGESVFCGKGVSRSEGMSGGESVSRSGGVFGGGGAFGGEGASRRAGGSGNAGMPRGASGRCRAGAKRRPLALLLCAAQLAAAALLFAGCQATAATLSEAEPAPPAAVEVLNVSAGRIAKEMAYVGRVAPGATLSVAGKLSGKVTEVRFDVGDRVEIGDVLMRLDDKDILSQIDQINAQLKQSEQAIKTAENGLNGVTGGQYQTQVLQQEASVSNYDKQLENAQITIENAQLAVSNAQLALDGMQRDYDSTKALFDAGMAPQNDMNRIELALEQSKSTFAQAENALSQARVAHEQVVSAKRQAGAALGLTRGQIVSDNTRQAELAIEQATAAKGVLEVQLANVAKNLDDVSVTSPISGLVSARNAQAGEFASPQIAAFTIVSLDKVNVSVNVSETLINRIAVGAPIDVHISSVGDEPFRGMVSMVSPAADQTGTFPVKVEIDNPDGLIKPGMFAEARFVKEESVNAAVLPRDAVLTNASENYVYVVRDGIARKTPITLGIDNGREIEALAGVGVSEQVVVRGQSNITDGEQVNVVDVWEGGQR